MKDRSMLRRFSDGDVIDISECQRTPEGDYILPDVLWNRIQSGRKDIADGYEEKWILSVGRRLNDNVILASTANKFFLNKDFECLWLR